MNTESFNTYYYLKFSGDEIVYNYWEQQEVFPNLQFTKRKIRIF